MKNNILKIYPLTPMQNGMLYHSLLHPENANYYQQICFYLEGKIVVTALQEAWQILADRHEILRTNFIYKGVKTPVQVVLEKKLAEVCTEEITDLLPKEQDNYLQRFKARDLKQKFDFEKGKLNRLTIIKLTEQQYFLCWTFHHILFDGWSGGIVLSDFFQIYQALSSNQPLPSAPKAQFSEYLEWLKKQDQLKALAFWQEYLREFSEPTFLSVDENLEKTLIISKADLFQLTFGVEKTTELINFCKVINITTNTLIETAWGILLQKYNNTLASCFGMTVSGRPPEINNVAEIAGLFISTVPVFIKTEPKDTGETLLQKVHEQLINVRDYHYISLADLQKMHGVEKMFDSLIVFENYPVDRAASSTLDLTVRFDSIFELTTFDLCIEAVVTTKTVFRLAYNCAKYTSATAEKMLQHFELILWALIKHPAQEIVTLALITENEKKHLLYDLNATKAEYSAMTIEQLFYAQVKKTPEKIAVVFEENVLTYCELNQQSNQLARFLRAKGIKPDELVGLMVDRSLEMLIAVFGILKAGGACLPLDPDYPRDRLEYMLKDSKPKILLTQHQFQKHIEFDGEVVDLQNYAIFNNYDNSDVESVIMPENLLYVIYTSGSTGKPKGVMLEHKNLVNLISFSHQTQIDFTQRVLQFNPISFDVSFQEIFSTLLAGGELYLLSKELKENLPALFKYVEQKQISILFLPAAFLKFVFNEIEFARQFPRNVRHIITAGEQLIISNQLRQFLQENHTYLHNHYGPSETHVVTTLTLDPTGVIPEIPSIGRPISNTRIYIFGQGFSLLPEGIPGELCIGGDAVGRGYFHQPLLTAEKFVANPLIPGERIYKTGDLARWRPDGSIEFLGRLDNQVKIRGFRIELGEIESCLFNHSEIKNVVVVDKVHSTGEKYLAAYIVAKSELSPVLVKEYLAEHLPDYMVPACFIFMEKLPLTPSGKINRQALCKSTDTFISNTEYLPPVDQAEEVMAKLWSEILNVNQVGRSDDFFTLGGHSLKATQLISRVFKEFNVELPLRTIFQYPTLQEFVQSLKKAQSGDFGAIQPVAKKDYYPVSSAQKRLFIIRQLEGESVTYNIPSAVIIEGNLDIARLEKAFQEILQRHEALRTSFKEIDGEVVQQIHGFVPFKVQMFTKTDDQSLDSETLTSTQKINQVLEHFIQPFDLSQAPLFRIGLLKITETQHVLLLDIHHIITDGLSYSLLFTEFANLYQGKTLPELRIQYKDFALWQNQLFSTERFSKQEKYWLQVFTGEIPVLNLPTDYSRPKELTYRGDMYNFTTSAELMSKLTEFSTEKGVTLYMILLAAFNVFLAKYSGQDDIIIGSPIAGRRHPDLEKVMGMFVNTLAMRNYPVSAKTFSEFLAEVKENALLAYENQDYQFEMLLDHLELNRELNRNPLFDVMFALQNLDKPDFLIENLTFQPYNFNFNIAKFDLTLNAFVRDGIIHLSFEYSAELFKPATIVRMSRHLLNIFEHVITKPYQQIASIELPDSVERKEILQHFNQTSRDYPKDQTLQRLFEAQVQKTPEGIALLCAGEKLTYSGLNAKANQLARVLRANGVRVGEIVGLLLMRRREMVIALLAVLKAGGAYLPLDPTNPAVRNKFMLEDAGVGILLTQADLGFNLDFAGKVINLQEEPLTGDSSNLENLNSASDLAYVIYTSGTTGKPKGNLTMHFNITRVVKNTNYLEITPEDTLLQLSNYAFDGSTFDFYGALLNGATLVMVPPETLLDLAELAYLIKSTGVTVFFVTTALFNTLVDVHLDCLKNIRKILFGGERISLQHARKAYAYLGPGKLLHVYGPTESTVFATYYPIDHINEEDVETIPIGRPLANTQAYILGKNHELQPVGVPGELCLAGDGLAKGYLHHPELSVEKFNPNPFQPGTRLYHTGDLAKWLPDGNIEFIGRIDEQVKIRGYRIELGEIEFRLKEHPEVKTACVITKTDLSGHLYLLACLTTTCELSQNELKTHLLKDLPDYMLPASFLFLENMPLTTNGKIDRKKLTELTDNFTVTRNVILPQTELEKKMAEIWSEILNVTQVGLTDNFFELGGHSLKASRLVARVLKEFNVKLPLKQIFATPTLKAFVEKLTQSEKGLYTAIPKVQGIYQDLPENNYPVSSAQKRLYVLKELEGEGVSYNMPQVMVIDGFLDRECLIKACQVLIKRHESLRTTFNLVEGIVVQKINQQVEFELWQPKFPENLPMNEVKIQEIIREFVQPFDFGFAPLMRMGLVNLAADKYLFLLDMHHIISDGISMNIFINELLALYHGHTLPQLHIQYKDFAIWQNTLCNSADFKKQEQYWLNTFGGEIPLLDLPYDFPRPKEKKFAGATVDFTFDQGLSLKLNQLAMNQGVTLYMVLLAAFNLLLAKYSGQEIIIIGSPTAGRRHADLENVLGMFVNTLALRNQLKASETFADFLQEVKENVLRAFENQDYQFEMLVEKLALPRDLSRNPLFDVMFTLQNAADTKKISDELKFTPYHYQYLATRFDLVLNACEEDSKLKFSLEYSTDLFTQLTMERFTTHFTQLVSQIVLNPILLLAQIEFLTLVEKAQILQDFNATDREYSGEKTFSHLFAEQVTHTPDKIAISFGKHSWTYQKLNIQANQIARLLKTKGVCSEVVVGIMLERSLELACSVLGVLQAGGAYLPIDPGYPTERINFMLKDSNTHVLLTESKLVSKLHLLPENLQIIELDNMASWNNSGENETCFSSLTDLAYIIYTSGSTGQPKGVLVEHRNMLNTLLWRRDEYRLSPADRVLQLFSFAFDGFVTSFFTPLLSGAEVVFMPEEDVKDILKIKEIIKTRRITHFICVPSLYTVLLECLSPADVQDLKLVTLAGEAVKPHLVLKTRELSAAIELVNEYGPTENSVTTTFRRNLENDKKITIGQPIANTQIYLLDKDGNLLPPGITGEICISGKGLARGYLHNLKLTQEKFTRNPFNPNTRLYHTGDLARWLIDGRLEFLGRIDQQVKIRGYRIELAEIENLLLQHPAVKEAVVLTKTPSNDSQSLVCYLSCEGEVAESELSEYLALKLPDYMMPSSLRILAALPHTSTGKIDQQTLLKIEHTYTTQKAYQPPRTWLEIRLAQVWSELLGVEKVGLNDSFFELGGHSLKATQLISRIFKEFQVKLTLKQIFTAQTLKELSKILAKTTEIKYAAITPVQQLPGFKAGYYPTSSVQKRLFTLNALSDHVITYNMPQIMLIEGQLIEERFFTALQQLVNRHEALRTSFHLFDGEILQYIHPKVNLTIWQSELSKDQNPEDLIREFIKPFNLAEVPLMRIGLIKLAPDKNLFLLDMHHIISDGTSMGIIWKDLFDLYRGLELQELRIQYKDFAVWQNEFLHSPEMQKEEDFWLNTLAPELPILDLPTDFPRQPVKTFSGKMFNTTLDVELTHTLTTLANTQGATFYMMLLAVFNVLLAKYTGQTDIIIGTPIAGRRHADLENVVGMFVNTLALRNYPGQEKTFDTFLAEVKENALKAYDNQDYQFETLLDKLALPRDLSRNPLFDVMLVLQNTHDLKVQERVDNLEIKPYPYPLTLAKFDLTVNLFILQEQLYLNLEYCTDIFTQGTIARMAHHLSNLFRVITANPGIQIADIDFLSPNEKAQLLVDFNHVTAKSPVQKTLQQLFEEQVLKTPEAMAITGGEAQLTYRELNARANQLARVLQKKGLKTNQVVGVFAKGACNLAISILASLKAGGAYLPIDHAYPEERVVFMLQDSGAGIIVIPEDLAVMFQENYTHLQKWQAANQTVYLLKTSTESTDNLPPVSTSEDLAYVIYTSGSTGEPKGVMIEHRNIVNTVIWRKNEYEFTSNARILQLLSFAFDASVAGFFATLLSGAELIMAEEGIKEPEKLKKIIQTRAITHLITVPSFYQAILEYILPEDIEHLQMIILGGEELTPKLITKTRALKPGLELVNEYGPTECSVTATCLRKVESAEHITIGRPIANTQICIVDYYQHLLPIGVVGEICIAGEGLARGYLNQPKITAKKFITHPFVPESRLYLTGDKGRWLDTGEIEFLGRIDHQVKIRGYRIELGEIEKKILEHPVINEVTVLDQTDSTGNKYLCAYLVAKEEISPTDMRKFLLEKLPEYMVPTYFISLKTLPLTLSGKIDRRALPGIEVTHEAAASTGYVKPRNEFEMGIAKLWSEILGLENVGIDDNFFILGGHSLKAVSFVGKLQHVMQIQLSVSDFIKFPTIRQLSEMLNPDGEFIQQKVAGKWSDGEVLLKAAFNTERNLFLIHDGSGEVSSYTQFCSHLTCEVNCWGIKVGLSPSLAPQNLTMDKLVTKYIAQIQTIRPVGPYYLAGWSIGGTIAYAIARELEKRGEEVAFVALFDTLPVGENQVYQNQNGFTSETELHLLKELIPQQELIQKWGLTVDVETIWQEFLKILTENPAILAQFKAVLSPGIVRLIPDCLNIGADELLYRINMIRSLGFAHSKYMPTGQLATEMHYFAATASKVKKEIWSIYCAKEVNYYSIICDHFSMFQSPAVERLAEEVSLLLKK